MMKKSKIHHSALVLFDAERNKLVGDERAAALREFRETGTMLGVFFGRVGGSWEVKGDPSTWGPETVADVDWTGFDA